MVDAFKCLEKETKTTKNTVQGKFRLCTVLKSVHEPIRVREKSLTARLVADAHTERIYGCLSIFYHCFDFHGHVHGSRTRITIHGLMDGYTDMRKFLVIYFNFDMVLPDDCGIKTNKETI